jgi:hypothetical protein
MNYEFLRPEQPKKNSLTAHSAPTRDTFPVAAPNFEFGTQFLDFLAVRPLEFDLL